MIDSLINSFYQFLESLGYAHPVHATQVHMPIGLVVGAFLFGFTALFFRKQILAGSARHCIILAFIFWFPTVLFGLMDWQHFYGGAWLFPIKMKIPLAGLLFILLIIGIILGFFKESVFKGTLFIYVIAFLNVVALGYFGGNLVYGGMQPTAPKEYKAGEKLFRHQCSACHPHGGNAIMSSMPINGSSDLESFKTFDDFIRHPALPDGKPGPMPPFSPSRIPDQKAKELYDYIVNVLEKPRG
jgi:uncharacterized membrane protein